MAVPAWKRVLPSGRRAGEKKLTWHRPWRSQSPERLPALRIKRTCSSWITKYLWSPSTKRWASRLWDVNWGKSINQQITADGNTHGKGDLVWWHHANRAEFRLSTNFLCAVVAALKCVCDGGFDGTHIRGSLQRQLHCAIHEFSSCRCHANTLEGWSLDHAHQMLREVFLPVCNVSFRPIPPPSSTDYSCRKMRNDIASTLP